MNFSAIIFGLLLIFIGLFFTILTFGFGIICSWPIIFIGLILFIVGLIVPSKKNIFKPVNNSYLHKENSTKKVCPKCARAIIFNAKFCPYCGNKFKEY